MKQLEDKIRKEARIFPGNVLNVGSFLNQQIDVPFMMDMGKELARLYQDAKVNKILTVESSGIALAMAVACHMNAKLVFAKKKQTANMDDNVYSAKVYSYTHGLENRIVVSRAFLTPEDRVLIVDDFLAMGEALNGMIELCRQAHAAVAGCGIAIEKGFQPGGDALRKAGIRVESLAIIDRMTEDELVFR